MSLPKVSPDPVPAPDAVDVESWIGVGPLVEEVCRELAVTLPGAVVAIDCSARLEVPVDERKRLCRTLGHLILRTAVGVGTGGVEIVVRPAGAPAAPALLFAVQAISKERRTIRGGTGLDAEELALARELVERGGGRVLITRQLLGERRTMFGFDAPWRIADAAVPRLGRAAVASATPRAAQLSVASAPSPVPPRNAAAEIPYSLSR